MMTERANLDINYKNTSDLQQTFKDQRLSLTGVCMSAP